MLLGIVYERKLARNLRYEHDVYNLARGSRYLIKELGLKDHDHHGFWGLSPLVSGPSGSAEGSVGG